MWAYFSSVENEAGNLQKTKKDSYKSNKEEIMNNAKYENINNDVDGSGLSGVDKNKSKS